eukprot:TRINITY_DN199_c0_g1_i5.p1 TRINITY_DN199_c0_g1~~TRINITY_DN199_c0_g1_i5.p1  ORF type:complete len:243 (-),score=71.37 TRINITY_DN199_c0_g1_i5:750-1439(-)
MAEEVVKTADELSEKKEFNKALEVLLKGHSDFPNDIEIWWRISRAYFDVFEQLSNADEKKDALLKGLEHAEAALKVNDSHYATHKWWAILTSSLGEFVSTKEKIANAYKIKEHALKALELNPQDSTTLHLLGRWCFSVANIGWIERTAASALFGTPPSSSFDEALGYFLKAAEICPNFVRNSLFIADSYANLKQYDKAKQWYQKTIEIPVEKESDRKYHNEAKQKLSSY